MNNPAIPSNNCITLPNCNADILLALAELTKVLIKGSKATIKTKPITNMIALLMKLIFNTSLDYHNNN